MPWHNARLKGGAAESYEGSRKYPAFAVLDRESRLMLSCGLWKREVFVLHGGNENNMNVKCAMLTVVMAAFACAASAAELYVDDDAPADVAADGTQAKPFKTIQEAINIAGANDVINVAEGIYGEGKTLHENNTYSRVYIKNKPGLKIIGAGRGKSVIAGSRLPGAGGFAEKNEYIRCVYVTGSAGAIIEGFTLRDGEANKDNVDGQYGGGFFVGDGSKEVYFVDCEIVHCSARLGGGAQGGTAVRCLFDGNYGLSGQACRNARLINCVVTRTSGSSSAYATLSEVKMYNCTVFDNRSTGYIIEKKCEICNCLFGLNSTKGRRAAEIDSDATVTGENNVFASTAPKGPYQLAGPAVGDWRLLHDSDAIGAGAAIHLSSLSLPASISAFKDFTGDDIVPDGEGAINAGALQRPMGRPAAGALFFNCETDNYVYEVDGYAATNKFESWVYPETYPTQYCVKVNPAQGRHIYRITRKDPLTGNASKNYPAMVPFRDGTMWMMPPPSVSMNVTNAAESTTVAFYVDPDLEISADNVNDGSVGAPFASIQKAIDSAADDTVTIVYLLPGVHTNGLYAHDSRGNFRAGIGVNNKKIRIVSTSGADVTTIKGAPDEGAENGLGPNAVKGLMLHRNIIVQDVTIADCYSDSSGNTGYGAALFADSSISEYPAQIVDCTITNCHAYQNIAVNYMVYKRCRFFDSSTRVGYVISDSASTKYLYPMFSCYARNLNNFDSSNSQYGLVGGKARIFQSTFTGTIGKGRLTGSNNVSYNSIWYGGLNIYSTSVFTNCIVYKPTGTANGIYEKTDPLFVDVYAAGKLLGNSPAIGAGGEISPDNFGSVYWRYACGDIDGRPIVFSPDGKPTLGAFQTASDTVRIEMVAPTDGGWKLSDGTEYGELELEPGGSITIVADKSFRNCLGVKAGEREFRFADSADGAITIGYDDIVRYGLVKAEGIYAKDWYADADNGDDANTGFSPGSAKRTLAAAVEYMVSGDTLHVAPGYYDDGSTVYSGQTTPNRVKVKSGTAVVSTDGPENTFIIGGMGSANGPEKLRCAYVASNARLSGFTLTGGTNDTYKANDVNCMGGAVLGSGRENSAIVENCIITNNYSAQGTAANCDLFACRVTGNKSANSGGGVRQGNAYGCYFSNNRGDNVMSYCKYVWNCTIMRDNYVADGGRSTSIANTVDGGSILNTFVGHVLSASGNNRVGITNCVLNSNANLNLGANVSTSGIVRVDASLQSFTDYGLPVIGANAAIDAGDASINTDYPGNTDARGFQRVMNGAMDVGCYEADWRGVYAESLSGRRGFAVTRADAPVVLEGDAVKIPGGEFHCGWENASGRTRIYSFAVQVTGTGTLKIALNGGNFANLTSEDGAMTLEYAGRAQSEKLEFSYEPGENDTGCAVLGSFVRTSGGLIMSIR